MILNDFRLPTTNRPNVLQQAINTYGKTSQVDMAIEEMSELTKALLKERRISKAFNSKEIKEAREHIYEETADVIIMLLQLYLIFGGKNEMQDIINAKVARLAYRLGMEDK